MIFGLIVKLNDSLANLFKMYEDSNPQNPDDLTDNGIILVKLNTNQPTTASNWYTIIVSNFGNNYCTQLAIGLNGGGLYTRGMNPNGWGDWYKVTSS